jgi:hypothetical protein
LGSTLSGQQSKAERVIFSHELLEILNKEEENNFWNVLTGDAS